MAFQGLVGQFYTLPGPLTLPNGVMLPQGTRVFIHKVDYAPPAFLEMVTIVAPLQGPFPGSCVAGSAQVTASQLQSGTGGGVVMYGAPPGQPMFGAPPRPPR
ncbi:hypothetical protein [Bacillus taeanensis]|uniref:hypothetical protein n=1 Tax=Bacillus taeanensis TaxID=273032 RepID=UPI0015F027E3|nr:hypothetical protein [Bacillus taeanensis]